MILSHETQFNLSNGNGNGKNSNNNYRPTTAAAEAATTKNEKMSIVEKVFEYYN